MDLELRVVVFMMGRSEQGPAGQGEAFGWYSACVGSPANGTSGREVERVWATGKEGLG